MVKKRLLTFIILCTVVFGCVYTNASAKGNDEHASLACARKVYALPGAEFMMKLVTEDGSKVKSVVGLTSGLKLYKDRKHYSYIYGRAPKDEGVYHFNADGEEITLVVSANLQQPTPLMGWLSWNWFETCINHENMIENATAMKKRGLLDAGFEYYVLDDEWAVKHCKKDSLDYDKTKFPKGMKDVGGFTDTLHKLGFKAGIYSDNGSWTCSGYQCGSYMFEDEHVRKFEDWGFDLLKYDYCNNEDNDSAWASYKRMGDAINNINKERAREGKVPFVLNICEWGQNKPWLWGAESGGSSWRCTYDSREIWNGSSKNMIGVLNGIDVMKNLWPYGGVNRWNDADMMMIGLHGLGCSSNDVGENFKRIKRMDGLTDTQVRTQMSMWCMFASPLTICADFRDNPDNPNTDEIVPKDLITAADIATLTNKYIVSIDQDALGQQAEYMKDISTGEGAKGYEIYVKDLSNGKKAIAVLNRSSESIENVKINLKDVYLSKSAKYTIKDVWSGESKEISKCIETGKINPCETKVYLIIKNQ